MTLLTESPSSNYVSEKPHICNNNTMHKVSKPRKNILEQEVLTEDIFIEEDVLNVSKDGSKIVEFYKDKCVFVTGASGFLGKILVEKLLRACEDLQTIYILIRDKKGKDIHTRMDEIYNDVVSEIVTRSESVVAQMMRVVLLEFGSLCK